MSGLDVNDDLCPLSEIVEDIIRSDRCRRYVGFAPGYWDMRLGVDLVLDEQGQCLARFRVQRGIVRAMTDMIFIMTGIVDIF